MKSLDFGVDCIKGNFDFLKDKYGDLFSLIDKMECNVFTNPDKAILNGSLFLENLIGIVLDTETIPKGKNPYQSIEKLKSYKIISYEMKNKFHRARQFRNTGIHEIPDQKQAFQLCALLFHISIWFYEKYGQDSKFRKPIFDRSLIVEKNKKANDEYLEELNDDEVKSNDEKRSFTFNSDKKQLDEQNKQSINQNLTKTNGSYLLTELSKLKKSSKESIEDSNGFKDNFKKYMHVDREIQVELENKLVQLNNENSSQLILLSGSVGDGKSHLLSYMKYKHPDLMDNFEIHNDATESFDPNLTAIETLKKVLEPFSDDNIQNSEKKLILAINLGILSNLMEDEYIQDNFSKLLNILNKLNIFDNSTVTTNVTEDFLTVINFTDYQLYELNDTGVSSDFILKLLNKVTKSSKENPFYSAYEKDVKNNLKSPIIYNYRMLMDDEVKNIVIQSLIKCIVKNKKIISTRELLNFIYEIIVPADFVLYPDIKDVSKYIDDLLPCLLFNTKNRSEILKDMSYQSPINIRSRAIDDFIISLNTLNIKTVLEHYFDDNEEFRFFKEFLLSKSYEKNKNKQKIIKNSLIYFIFFFGVENIKRAFVDEFYKDYLKYLYYYNYDPRKIRKLFSMITTSILSWRGSIKKDYVIIDELQDFIISKRISIDFKQNKKSENNLKNNFKNNISFNVHNTNDFCDGDLCIGDLCNEQNCVKLNVDYLLFEAINKINKGYKPNKNEKENLIVFDDFIDEILSKKGDNELFIMYKANNSSFKFKSSSGNYYSLEGD